MKQLLFVFALSCALTAHSQDSAKKYSLPPAAYSNEANLNTAMKSIASSLLQIKTDKSVNRVLLYLLTDDFEGALHLIDSTAKAGGSIASTFNYRVYADAGLLSKRNNAPFIEAFRKIFHERFALLKHNQKLKVAGIDSSVIAEAAKGLKTTLARMQKSGKDSITWKEAQMLAQQYSRSWLLNAVAPVILPVASQKELMPLRPGIKGTEWAAIAPLDEITFHSDPSIQYNLLFELTSFMGKDNDSSVIAEQNGAIAYSGRLINLHLVDGIPKKNLNIVMAIHGGALNAFLTNEKYRAKFGMDNPNLKLIKELQDFGVTMIACGQAMFFQNLEKNDLVEGMKVAVSAQTVLSYFQLKNYVLYDLGSRD